MPILRCQTCGEPIAEQDAVVNEAGTFCVGQEPGGLTKPQDREANQRREPNDDRHQGGCGCK